MPTSTALTLPVGTQVVTQGDVTGPTGAPLYPAGAVGAVITAPEDDDHAATYRVRFPDGGEADLTRRDLAVRKHVRQDRLRQASAVAERDLYQYVIYRCVVGSRAYGRDDAGSDWDYRGAHILPLREVVGLDPGRETIEASEVRDGLEVDLVTHDVRKFCGLLLKKNGYVLEQLYSPLIVRAMPEHDELKAIAADCVTRHHSHHYAGFAETQWRLFEKERPRRVKPLLYVYRVLLTGIHLMRGGVIEANLVRLNDEYRLPYIPDLIARKLAGPEQARLDDADIAFYHGEYERLRRMLEDAFQSSALPDAPSAVTKTALNDLLVRLRLQRVLLVDSSSKGGCHGRYRRSRKDAIQQWIIEAGNTRPAV